jgi:hypothetical protein
VSEQFAHPIASISIFQTHMNTVVAAIIHHAPSQQNQYNGDIDMEAVSPIGFLPDDPPAKANCQSPNSIALH